MKVSCPKCAYIGQLMEFANDADARRCLGLAMKFPPALADLLVRYLQLFSPAKRALRWERAAKLMAELAGAIDKGTINRKGRDWAAPLPVWAPAIRAVLAKQDELDLPLADHAYLYEIIRRQANQAEAHAENQVEAQRQHRADTPAPKTPQPRPPLPAGGLKGMVKTQAQRLRSAGEGRK